MGFIFPQLLVTVFLTLETQDCGMEILSPYSFLFGDIKYVSLFSCPQNVPAKNSEDNLISSLLKIACLVAHTPLRSLFL